MWGIPHIIAVMPLFSWAVGICKAGFLGPRLGLLGRASSCDGESRQIERGINRSDIFFKAPRFLGAAHKKRTIRILDSGDSRDSSLDSCDSAGGLRSARLHSTRNGESPFYNGTEQKHSTLPRPLRAEPPGVR